MHSNALLRLTALIDLWAADYSVWEQFSANE